ncbi:polysaccharide biosynthesis protein [Brucella sp. IR073]|uniref:polysaccharide biosynthesis protein n=1 Tax=unclassified Brucella TaxID=2632610 RepID=UPI003B981544
MTSLAEIATGRPESLFAPDIEKNRHLLSDAIRGTRILAIGAAGSIGSQTVLTLSRYRPRSLHVVDQNENGLAEFVRQFRSSPATADVADMRTMPLDYGSVAMERLLEHEGPYDLIFNFAAIKHVRSEKDEYSILQMLDTNIVKQARLMRWIAAYSKNARYFSVSTDKAANPSSFMGATKRIMEHVMFADDYTADLTGPVTSARFANVAFSNGSLLESFQNRFRRREPIACPKGIRRYFVSLAESGEICTLAGLLIQNRHVAVPKLDPETNLVELEKIAERFIRHHGYEPTVMTDEAEAKAKCAGEIAAGRWPLILTAGDTAGEKPYEEFIAEGESAEPTSLSNIDSIRYIASRNGQVAPMVEALERIVLGIDRGAAADKEAVKRLIAKLEPAFLETHRASALNLDQRM